MEKNLDISVVVPVYNERENISELHTRIVNSLKSSGDSYEIIFVDDGSTDGSFDEIKILPYVRGFRLNKNYGKSLALECGIRSAVGKIIVTIDGDLENFPEDIPLFVDKIHEGYDVVQGWRKDRWKKNFFTRKFPSVIANKAISFISNLNLHDHGCGLTAFRSEILKDFIFSNDIHRMMIPHLAINNKIDVCEVEVRFSPRKFGKSKYGLSRIFKVFLDLILYIFFKSFSQRPIHFFGYAGFVFFLFAIVSFTISLYVKIFKGVHFNRTPLPELIAIFTVVAFQFILMGLLAEIIKRSLYQIKGDSPYKIIEETENRE